MRFRPATVAALLLLALGMAAGTHAQDRRGGQEVLPVVDNASGKVQAFLILEPAPGQAGARWRSGSNTLDAAFGIESGNSLALLCDRAGFSAISSLANNCMLAELSGNQNGNHHATATATLTRPGGRIGLTLGEGRGNLPAWLNRGNATGQDAGVDVNDLTVFAQKNVGNAGFVSIAGTVARARLVPFASAPKGLADGWDTRSLEVGGGYGAFSANIIGRVIDTPGQPRFEGLGLGLTWRTPWSGQITVGAENIVTRGRNPFSPRNESLDEGAVPYIRYEQDL